MLHKSAQRLRPLPFNAVQIDDAFWSPRLQLVQEQTIPYQYQQCQQTGRIDALRLNWQPGQEPRPHIFWESDVAKWIEAASYSLALTPDPALDALLDQVIGLLAGAQQPDGYLNVYYTVVEPGKRWTDLCNAHELYCAGHLIEAAVAHFQATGKRTLLEIVQRYADYIATVFGREPGQKRGYSGHEEIELALIKLYQVTGNQTYLNLSSYFVDVRGQQPYYFEQEARERGTPGFFGNAWPEGEEQQKAAREYNQSHLPVREQDEVVGHAVRAMYLYCAMADLALELGDESLARACYRLWQHLTSKRMYITGGIGTSKENEGFTSDYDLPNETAYAETCAAIGLVFWAQRMVHLNCDGCYIDTLEQALYNGVLSGISLDGKKFFYDNPLASNGQVHRQEWFGCACCPPNIARLITSLGQYMYSQSEEAVVVHLYASNTARLQMKERVITLQQRTRYPWDGAVRIDIDAEQPTAFTLALRIPGWCEAPSLRVNGETIDLQQVQKQGYAYVERTWRTGDTLELDLPMRITRNYAHPRVSADIGRVALKRGPLVYCLEAADQSAPLQTLVLPTNAPLQASYEPEVLNGMVVIRGVARRRDERDWSATLYRTERPQLSETEMTAIPYFAWDNRQAGTMQVWIRESDE